MHGAVLAAFPTAVVVGVGLWWCANTVSHNFIHGPFFRARWMNRVFSAYLSLLLGVPQTVWRERHLAHHAGRPWRFQWSAPLALEMGLLAGLWSLIFLANAKLLLLVYIPGLALGLALCWLHGHFEHARGTVSHYGSVYNVLFFNDGFHVEHHRRPGLHWSLLPRYIEPGAQRSRWPAVLRWLERVRSSPRTAWLDQLERTVLRSALLQRALLRAHERAFRKLLPGLRHARRIAIVGGGLFPRSALILRRLLPETRLTVIDVSRESLDQAMPLLPQGVEIVNEAYDPEAHGGYDVVVFPLAFRGDRASLYRGERPAARVVHDWIWRPRGSSAIVSCFLLKRLNLVTGA